MSINSAKWYLISKSNKLKNNIITAEQKSYYDSLEEDYSIWSNSEDICIVSYDDTEYYKQELFNINSAIQECEIEVSQSDSISIKPLELINPLSLLPLSDIINIKHTLNLIVTHSKSLVNK